MQTAAAFGLHAKLARLEAWARFYDALSPTLVRELNAGSSIVDILLRAPEPARAAFEALRRHECPPTRVPLLRAVKPAQAATPKPPNLADERDVALFALPATTTADEYALIRECMPRFAWRGRVRGNRAATYLGLIHRVAAEHPDADDAERVELVGQTH
jgi:hypothetical protein